MFQPPGSTEMMRVVHGVELAEAERRARHHHEARGGGGVRRTVGRALIVIGTVISGERHRGVGDQDEASAEHSPPSGPRSVITEGGC